MPSTTSNRAFLLKLQNRVVVFALRNYLTSSMLPVPEVSSANIFVHPSYILRNILRSLCSSFAILWNFAPHPSHCCSTQSPHPLPHAFFVRLCLFVCLIPSVPLGHQPGSLFHQCHPFPYQSWCLHTKLPICTLPAFCGPHGCRGPQDHAPPARCATTLRRPTRSLPAGPYRLPTWLPRWELF